MVAASWLAAILSRTVTPASPMAVPGWANATPGTAHARMRSGSSGLTIRTLISSGTRGAGASEPSASSGCACTARPASVAADSISGAVRLIHSKDSGISSSRCLARTARTSAAVTGRRAPRRGRA